MKKKIILIIIISMSIFMSGYENQKPEQLQIHSINNTQANQSSTIVTDTREKDFKSSNNMTYQLIKNVYTNKNVTVNYPQIINLGDDNKQNKINELIKNEALYGFTNGVDDNLSLEINYDIKLESADVVSILYSGVAGFKGAAHPTNLLYTTNINIKNGKKLKLVDLIKIDENLAKNFKKGRYINLESIDNPESSQQLQSAVADYVNNIDINDLIKDFNQSDNRGIKENPSNTFSYLTKDSIVISITVPHPIGDHAEYEIKYKDIQNNINFNIPCAKD